MRPAAARCAAGVFCLTALLLLSACQPRGRGHRAPGPECWSFVPWATGDTGGAIWARPGRPDAAGWDDPRGDGPRQRPSAQSDFRGASRYLPLWGRHSAARFSGVCRDLGRSLCGPRARRYGRLGGHADQPRVLRCGAEAHVRRRGRRQTSSSPDADPAGRYPCRRAPGRRGFLHGVSVSGFWTLWQEVSTDSPGLSGKMPSH